MNNMNRAWRLEKRPVGTIQPTDLSLVEEPIPELEDGQILKRNIYLSVDPTNRIWMSDREQYMPPVEIGDVMRGGTLGVVESSRHAGFEPGDLVNGLGGWQTHHVASGDMVNKLPGDTGIPLPAFMSALGATGVTAYFGLLDIGQPKAGETVVVSAAAGAVGSIVGQIAKIKGCRVIGISGSDEKCAHVVDDFGFDGAINYKTENVAERLRVLCPDGIDVDFENVGGPIFDAIMEQINLNARIVLCGMISTYNESDGAVRGPDNFDQVLMKRARIEGLIVSDYLNRWMEAMTELGTWVMEGKIKYDVDIVDGIENTLTALDRIFAGANIGKQLVRLSPEP